MVLACSAQQDTVVHDGCVKFFIESNESRLLSVFFSLVLATFNFDFQIRLSPASTSVCDPCPTRATLPLRGSHVPGADTRCPCRSTSAEWTNLKNKTCGLLMLLLLLYVGCSSGESGGMTQASARVWISGSPAALPTVGWRAALNGTRNPRADWTPVNSSSAIQRNAQRAPSVVGRHSSASSPRRLAFAVRSNFFVVRWLREFWPCWTMRSLQVKNIWYTRVDIFIKLNWAY